MVLLSLQLFEQVSYKKETKDSRTQCCAIWETVCKHLVFLEEKGERPKVMGDALNVQVRRNGLSRATHVAHLKSLDSWRKGSLLPGVVLWGTSHDILEVCLKTSGESRFLMLLDLKGEKGSEENNGPAGPTTGSHRNIKGSVLLGDASTLITHHHLQHHQNAY